MAFYSLEQVLKSIMEWEKRLHDFYAALGHLAANKRSQKTIKALQAQQGRILEVLKRFNDKEYKGTEYIKHVPQYHDNELIPQFEIGKGVEPQDILQRVLAYEEKLYDYYQHLRNIVVYEKSQEILDMLLELKIIQLKEIRGYIDSFDLVF